MALTAALFIGKRHLPCLLRRRGMPRTRPMAGLTLNIRQVIPLLTLNQFSEWVFPLTDGDSLIYPNPNNTGNMTTITIRVIFPMFGL